MKILSIITYTIYIIFWETLTIGGGGYIVFKCDRSPWWFLLAIILSSLCFRPHNWHCLFDKDLAMEKLTRNNKGE